MEVSIITINYNSSEYTINLVKSILTNISSDTKYEIIITDNASENHDYKNLVDKIPKDSRVKILKSNINTGFAGGNMNGYSESCGEYLLFINNDCECLNDILHPLISFIKNNKKFGLLTGKVIGTNGKYTGTHKLFPCFTKSIFGTAMNRLIQKEKFISPKVLVIEPIKVQIVTGAFMFFNREVFKRINGFDINFFLYCEEEDISKRVWDAGKEVWMVPQAEVFHKSGGSSGSNPHLINEYYISYRKLIFKHYSFPYALIMMSLVYLKLLKKAVFLKVNLSLIKLALLGFPERCSLRYKQK